MLFVQANFHLYNCVCMRCSLSLITSYTNILKTFANHIKSILFENKFS